MSDVEVTPTLSPLPVGTKVKYFGSQELYHGEYVITRIYKADSLRDSGRDPKDYFIDGVGYELAPPGVVPKFGNRDQMLYFVRRGSISPIPVMVKPDKAVASVKKGDLIRIIPERGPERHMIVAHVEHHIITLSDSEQIWEDDTQEIREADSGV
jgi:hypothetical protein